MTNKAIKAVPDKSNGSGGESAKNKKTNPEDIPVTVTERELKEQLGHMTVQLLASEKIQIHLREIIKGLRAELEKS